MTHVTCRLTAKNRNRLWNPTLGNRVWAAFTFFSVRVPAGDAASCVRLELSNDLRQFHVTLFLQVRQNSRSEEDLALTDAVQVSVQIQRLDLTRHQLLHYSTCRHLHYSHNY